jgi:predicted nucleic acid-binding Zn ribbon protein
MEKYRDYSSRKKEVAPLEEAFGELLKAYRLKDKYDERLLIQAWPEMMGNTVASRTTSVYIKEKKLFVKVTSGAIKKEMSMNRSKIIEIIEQKFEKGVITDIVFL